MMKYTFLLWVIFGAYACQKSSVDPVPNNIVDLSFDSLKIISVNIPNDEYNDLIFLNETTGFAVSRTGKIIKTTDGGNNWSNMNVPANPNLQLEKIQFTDDQTGYAIGIDYSVNPPMGVLLKTTDAGANWTKVSVPVAQFAGMHFFDNQNGFLSGYRLYKTTDGGLTWTTGTLINLKAVNFKNRNEGILTAHYGVFYKTMNGGVSWDSTKTTYEGLFYNIYFTNTKTFITQLAHPSLVDINDPSAVSFKPLHIEKLYFLDPNKCIGIGKFWLSGEIYLTNDCWITSDKKVVEAEKFTAISKVNDHKIMILGQKAVGTTVVLTYHY